MASHNSGLLKQVGLIIVSIEVISGECHFYDQCDAETERVLVCFNFESCRHWDGSFIMTEQHQFYIYVFVWRMHGFYWLISRLEKLEILMGLETSQQVLREKVGKEKGIASPIYGSSIWVFFYQNRSCWWFKLINNIFAFVKSIFVFDWWNPSTSSCSWRC